MSEKTGGEAKSGAEIDAALSEATTEQLIAELQRRKEVVCSIWTVEDVRDLVADADGAEDFDDAKVEEVSRETLSRAAKDLEDSLGSHGNEFLDQFWAREGDDILQAASRSPKI